jgi:predicted nucleic acid-binding protein/GNAT superfamily N-acetyltransferase
VVKDLLKSPPSWSSPCERIAGPGRRRLSFFHPERSIHVAVAIQLLDRPGHLFDQVYALWRRHSGFLGHFPRGAFEDHLHKECILVAIDGDGTLAGYLLFRIARGRVSIVHLCVEEQHRKSRVGSALVEALAERTQKYSGIVLRCRRDFPASEFWPRVKFIAMGEKEGRGRDGGMLTYWYRSHGHPDLFSRLQESSSSGKVRAVIDANVFIDLYEEGGRAEGGRAEESQALLADWLTDVLELQCTPELRNEIARGEDAKRRKAQWARLTTFPTCSEVAGEQFDRALASVTDLLPPRQRRSDDSDRRQLAWAVAAEAEYFITHDELLLAHREQLREQLNLRLLRPVELIRQLDALEREGEYAPARLAGTELRLQMLSAGQEHEVVEALHTGHGGETRAQLLTRLRPLLAVPKEVCVQIVRDRSERVLALMATDTRSAQALRVPLLRVAPTGAARTLARHLLFKTAQQASDLARAFTVVSDPYPTPQVVEALQLEPFVHGEDGAWRRMNLRFMGPLAELRERLVSSRQDGGKEEQSLVDEMLRRVNEANERREPALAWEVERILWPAKVLGMGIPNFLVPIRPTFARELFDEELAKQDLFGARMQLALNREGVYYRASRPAVLKPQARILWYVSEDDRIPDSAQVRACSLLEEVVVGAAKDLFTSFRRFGIYTWRDVEATRRSAPDGSLMVVRFSNTELFPIPLQLAALRESAKRRGRGLMLAGPSPLEEDFFEEIYLRGERA